MPFIISVAGLSKAKEIFRVTKREKSLIRGYKLVMQAMTNMDPPVTVLIVAADGGCSDHVAKVTEHQLPILKLPTRLEVGNIVGVPSVLSCVLRFEGNEELLAEEMSETIILMT